MSRSIRKETSSFAFEMVGRLGGSSAGFVVAALNAASATSREVVVLRVLSAGILCPLARLKLSAGKFHVEPPFTSFDHLGGAGEQRWRHSEVEYPCRRVIDDKLKLCGLHDRQVRGFRTLEDATRIDTDLTIRIRQAGSVAHQPADFGVFTRPIGGRERVARSQEDQLDTSADKKGATADEKCVGSIARKCCEGRIDVPAGADIKGLDLQSNGARSRVHVSQYGLGVRVRRIDEHGDVTSCGYELAQEFQPFCYQLIAEKIDARRVAAGTGEASDKTEPDRVFRNGKDDRDRRGSGLGRQRRVGTSGCDDHGDLPANQFSYQRRYPIDLILTPAVFDRDVLALDMSGILKALAECAYTVRLSIGRTRVDDANHRRRGLLRARRNRPRGRNAADKRDERAALHSITSSASASSVGGMSKPSALAVTRLTTSSNLVGSATGMSAGFSPLRMQPV